MTEIREVAAFRAECRLRADRILHDAQLHALVHLANQAIGEQQAQAARLQAELDRYQGRTVFHCLDRDLAGITSGESPVPDAAVCDVVRATDTGRELVLAPGGWQQR